MFDNIICRTNCLKKVSLNLFNVDLQRNLIFYYVNNATAYVFIYNQKIPVSWFTNKLFAIK